MNDSDLRARTIAEVEWVLAWLKNDEPLTVAAAILARAARRITNGQPR